jgi:hypothetical protein
MIRKFGLLTVVAAMTLGPIGGISAAEKKYGPGVSDTEIKLGQTVPYSGPASAFSSYGRLMAGYFQMINAAGGINGRKINLISLDNAFSPPKAIEQTRKLVEDDGVLADVGTVGTTPNVAIQKYRTGPRCRISSFLPEAGVSPTRRTSPGACRCIRVSKWRGKRSGNTSSSTSRVQKSVCFTRTTIMARIS